VVAVHTDFRQQLDGGVLQLQTTRRTHVQATPAASSRHQQLTCPTPHHSTPSPPLPPPPRHADKHARGSRVVVDQHQALDQRVRVQQHERAHELLRRPRLQRVQLPHGVAQLAVRHTVVALLLATVGRVCACVCVCVRSCGCVHVWACVCVCVKGHADKATVQRCPLALGARAPVQSAPASARRWRPPQSGPSRC